LDASGEGGRIGLFLFSKSYINPGLSCSVEQNGAIDF
jgi:hypothetical protein